MKTVVCAVRSTVVTGTMYEAVIVQYTMIRRYDGVRMVRNERIRVRMRGLNGLGSCYWIVQVRGL